MHKFLMKAFCVMALFNAPASAQEKRAIAFDDLMAVQRLSDPQISPDGQWIAYTNTKVDKAANKTNSDIFLISLDGKTIRQVTNSPKGDSQPRWSPDGKILTFISNRDGAPQIYVISVNGGEARKLTGISTGADGPPVWSKDGKWLLFSSKVFPDCADDACNKKKSEEQENAKVKGRVYDRLLYRHWDAWGEGTRSHVFLASANDGTFRDVTPGDFDSPPIALGGSPDYAISPDGKEICFVRNPDPVVATSTNNALFVVPTAGGAETCLTAGNQGNDNNPVYSPDGKYIAYLMMPRPGFEADRQELMLYDRASGASKSLSANLDRSVREIVWAPASDRLYFTAEDWGRVSIYTVSIKGGDLKKLTDRTYNDALQISSDGKTLVFMRQAINHPNEIWAMNSDGKNARQLTHTNEALLAQLEMNPVEEFWSEGPGGVKVHSLMVKPPKFDPSKKYPMIFLVHGGPQGAWSDNFHFRWNAQMFAAPGNVVVMPNPRGSTGYGQKFTDEITGDWGGKVYDDLMGAYEDALKNYGFIDASRTAAAGASYGGYMMFWMMGHTDKFKCIVAHDGVFNAQSMYGSTEELWFTNWEYGGPYWEKPENFVKWSPSNFVQNWKTPILIVHGQQDMRVDLSEGLQAFTAAQLKGIPSKFLYFPDEGHWVLKPLNSELWYKTLLEWVEQWTKVESMP
jgi:dipeptidyl aminopeptidase/acylaminoacyl peptidase